MLEWFFKIIEINVWVWCERNILHCAIKRILFEKPFNKDALDILQKHTPKHFKFQNAVANMSSFYYILVDFFFLFFF